MIPSSRRIEVGIHDDAFRAVLETIPDAVALVEQSGRIAAVNQAAEQIFGRREEDLIGRPVEVLIPSRFHEQSSTPVSPPRARASGPGWDWPSPNAS